MNPAFVSTFAPLRASVFTPQLTSSRPVVRATTKMQLNTSEKPRTAFKRAEDDRLAKKESEYRGPQGFTPYAEKVNGRVAMFGFFVGLVAEIFSGVPINEQMLIMFSPLTHLVESLLRIAN